MDHAILYAGTSGPVSLAVADDGRQGGETEVDFLTRIAPDVVPEACLASIQILLKAEIDAVVYIPVQQDYETAIQSHVDEVARSRRYKSGDALASYVLSTISEWRDEAQVFVAWRDNVWQYAYSELAKVQGGVREQPTIEKFLSELPHIVW